MKTRLGALSGALSDARPPQGSALTTPARPGYDDPSGFAAGVALVATVAFALGILVGIALG